MAKKIIVNGYAYSWRDLRHRLDRVRIRLPQAMADAARNFFVDSFKRQGWYEGRILKKWKPRKKMLQAQNTMPWFLVCGQRAASG